MNKAVKHARIFLEKSVEPVTEDELRAALEEFGSETSFAVVKRALQDEKMLDVGVWYEFDTKKTMYMFYQMTDEEKRKKKEDLDWFNNLPG